MEPFLFTTELQSQYIEDYQVAHNLTGIYRAIRCDTLEICYIGLASDNLLKRVKGHLELLINNKHYNSLLQTLFNYKGIKFGLIDDCGGKTDYQILRDKERDYIYQLRDQTLLCNIQHNHPNIKAKHALERYKMIKQQIALNNFILSELEFADDEDIITGLRSYLKEIR